MTTLNRCLKVCKCYVDVCMCRRPHMLQYLLTRRNMSFVSIRSAHVLTFGQFFYEHLVMFAKRKACVYDTIASRNVLRQLQRPWEHPDCRCCGSDSFRINRGVHSCCNKKKHCVQPALQETLNTWSIMPQERSVLRQPSNLCFSERRTCLWCISCILLLDIYLTLCPEIF